MFKYIIEDYITLERIVCKEIDTEMLNDVETKYQYATKEKHQKHDKIVRDILNDKEEVCKIINKLVLR